MDNSNTYWENLSKKITDPGQTKNKRPDTSDIEIDFLRNYVKQTDDVFDIGSGTGLIINKLLPFVNHITAVEKFEGFTKHIVEADNMLVINAEILGFKIRRKFDIILCTGVAQCFNKADAKKMYQNLFDMLDEDGTMIVRMHCGLKEDVIVNGFSDELNTEYFAEYRKKESEISMLSEIGLSSIEVHDIFPDELNVWDNTRHFIFVCRKNK